MPVSPTPECNTEVGRESFINSRPTRVCALVIAIAAGACSSSDRAVEPAVPVSTETLPELVASEGHLDSIALPRATQFLALDGSQVVAHRGEIDITAAQDYVRIRPVRAWSGLDTIVVHRRLAPNGEKFAEFRIPIRVAAGPYGVRNNPYAGITWGSMPVWKVQLHDHPGVSSAEYRAYDDAGYHAVALMDYSGVQSLSYTWKARHWPPENWLPAALLSGFKNIKTLIPSGEEVGYTHLASPFMTEYIEKWEPSGPDAEREAWQYTSAQEAIDLIRERGGFPIVAHPWGDYDEYSPLGAYAAIEVYSAFAAFKREDARDPYFMVRDRNEVMRRRWDRLLLANPDVIGVAVNDHFGPGSRQTALSPRNRDSGKTLVFAPTATLGDLFSALRAGRVFAIEDRGDPKGQYPVVDSVWADAAGLHVSASASISWIVNGATIATGNDLLFASLPAGSRYARFEVRDGTGSAVYSQAFALALIGDRDNDGLVDERDRFMPSNLVGQRHSP